MEHLTESPKAKQLWQMTKKEFLRGLSKQVGFEGAAKLILSEPNTPMTKLLYGKEKFIGTIGDFHTYITPKGERKGTVHKFILYKWQKEDGTIRYLVHGLDKQGEPYTSVSSAIQFKVENGVPKILTVASSDERLGLASKLLEQVREDYGSFTYDEPISQEGGRLLHRDAIAKAISEGKPIPDRVLRDYPGIELGTLIDKIAKEGKLLYTGEALGLGKEGDIGVSFKARQALKEMRSLLEEHPELTNQVPKEIKLLLEGEAYEGIFEDLRKSLKLAPKVNNKEHLT